MLEGFAESFRRDRNANGGGILIFVRDDIPCKQLNEHSLPEDIKCIKDPIHDSCRGTLRTLYMIHVGEH